MLLALIDYIDDLRKFYEQEDKDLLNNVIVGAGNNVRIGLRPNLTLKYALEKQIRQHKKELTPIRTNWLLTVSSEVTLNALEYERYVKKRTTKTRQ